MDMKTYRFKDCEGGNKAACSRNSAVCGVRAISGTVVSLQEGRQTAPSSKVDQYLPCTFNQSRKSDGENAPKVGQESRWKDNAGCIVSTIEFI